MIPYHRPMKLSRDDYAEIHERIQNVLATGILTNGEYVAKLEEEIKRIHKVDYAILVNNCTMGLLICYMFLPSKRISIPVFTWDSVRIVLSYTEHQIEYCDIDKETWLMEKTDGYGIVSPNHTFGNVLEDQGHSCQIFDGAHCLGCKLESVGFATVLSLAPTKLVTACEGGIILTNNDKLNTYARIMRRYIARESEVHAIIGLQTLKHLDEVLAWKKKVYNYYSKNIPGQFQKIPIESNYNTIGFLNTEHLIIPEKIETRQYYENQWEDGGKSFPNAWYVYKNIVCLPSYYGVDYKQIVEDINEANEI